MSITFSKAKLQGFYKLTRIRTIMEFYPILIVLGFVATKSAINLYSIITTISILLTLVAAFIINDVVDSDDDAKDPKKVNRNPISAGIISKQEGFNFYLLFAAVGVLILLFINLHTLLLGIITTVIGYLYSAKPIRLKSRPIVDLLSHGFFLAAAIVLMFTYLPNATGSINTGLIVAGVYLFSIGGDLYNELRDWVVDRETGLKNTSHFLGIKASKLLSYILYTLGIGLCAYAALANLVNLY